MKAIKFFSIISLIFYTLYLIGSDFFHNSEAVRALCLPEHNSMPFNTTLVIFLFWGTALLFAVCCALSQDKCIPGEEKFYIFEIIFFALLGCMFQFIGVEGLKSHLFDSAPIVLAVICAIIQFLTCLIMLPAMFKTTSGDLIRPQIYALMVGILAFLLYLGSDLNVSLFRALSLRSLCLTWIAVFCFITAWRAILNKFVSPTISRNANINPDSITNRIIMQRTQNELTRQ